MDMSNAPQFKATGGRRTERTEHEAEVIFRVGTRKAVVKVRDISTHGARICGVYLVHQGDRFFLNFPGLESIEARVAWVADFEFGCEFARPLSPLILDSLILHRR